MGDGFFNVWFSKDGEKAIVLFDGEYMLTNPVTEEIIAKLGFSVAEARDKLLLMDELLNFTDFE